MKGERLAGLRIFVMEDKLTLSSGVCEVRRSQRSASRKKMKYTHKHT